MYDEMIEMNETNEMNKMNNLTGSRPFGARGRLSPAWLSTLRDV